MPALGALYLLPHLHAFQGILQASALSSFCISYFQITDAFIFKKNLCLILFFAITTFQYAVYLFIHLVYYLFSLGEGNGNLLQYSCLENPMDRGAWRATVHGVTESQTWLSNKTTTTTFSLPLKPQVVLQSSIVFLKEKSHSKDAEASSALPLYNALFLYWTVSNLKAGITAIWFSSTVPGPQCWRIRLIE